MKSKRKNYLGKTIIKSRKEDEKLYDLSWIEAFIHKHCLNNRTIVSKDNYLLINDIQDILTFKLHRYASGSDHSTWLVPPQWDVEEAYLADDERIIASYKDHPLFLSPYSKEFDGEITKDELLKKVFSRKSRPDDYLYQHRIAANFQLRLKDWGLTLPYNIVKNLKKDKYYVKIKTKVSKGDLIVAEHRVKGKSKKIFSFLAHTCHPGQANDGLAGVALGIALMKILNMKNDYRFSYELLLLPETFGSAIYLSNNENKIENYLGCLFLEMPGAGELLTFNHSRKGKLYFDYLLKYVVKKSKQKTAEFDFHRGMGNDELNFDWPMIDIPGYALYWSKFPEYHTSSDSADIIDYTKMKVYLNVLLEFIEILEDDYVPVYTQRVQVYQTRYNLYIDAFHEKDYYQKITDLLFGIDGKKTLFEITQQIDLPFDDAQVYLEKYVELGFLIKEEIPLSKYENNLIS